LTENHYFVTEKDKVKKEKQLLGEVGNNITGLVSEEIREFRCW